MKRPLPFLVVSALLCIGFACAEADGVNPETLKSVPLCDAGQRQLIVGERNFTALRNQPWDFPGALKSGDLEGYIYRFAQELEKRGITLIAVPIPFVYTVYPEYFPPAFLSAETQQRDVKAYDQMVQEFNAHKVRDCQCPRRPAEE